MEYKPKFLKDFLIFLTICKDYALFDNLTNARRNFSLKPLHMKLPNMEINGITFQVARFKQKYQEGYYLYRLIYQFLGEKRISYVVASNIRELKTFLMEMIYK